jgi:Uma2 family endonuclease
LPFSAAEQSIMAMPHTSQAWTAERVRAIPDDGNRYELIDGELVVTPAPRYVHQDAILELIRLLDPWLRNAGTAKLLMSPADISLGEDEILQPDLFVYRTAGGKSIRDWKDITSLLLVIEVLSPSTARYDRQLKRRRYQRAGVPEYWVVDLDARLIERWRPADQRPEILDDRLTWSLQPDGNALDIDVTRFFADVHGDG